MDIVDRLRCVLKGVPSAQEAAEEIKRLRMVENHAELLAEDIECLHMCLDDSGVPRDDGHGNVYSMWGRVQLFKAMPPNVKGGVGASLRQSGWGPSQSKERCRTDDAERVN